MKAIIFFASAMCLIFGYGCGQEPPPSPKAQNKPDYAGTQAPKKSDAKQEQSATVTSSTATSASQPTTNTSAATATGPATGTAAKSTGTPSTSSDISSGSALGSVLNYGTGQTQLTIKKTQTEKIQKLQDQHNKTLEENLNK